MKFKVDPGAMAVTTVIVVVIAIGLATYSLSYSNGTKTNSNVISAYTLSENGLRLSLSENSSVVSNGGGVELFIDLYNTLSEPVNVSSADLWPVANLSLSACGRTILPYGLAIFKGYYGVGNVTTATALDIFSPSNTNSSSSTGSDCPNPALFSVPRFYFNPNSDMALIGNGRTLQMSLSMTFEGYWVANVGVPLMLHPFTPGIYTVVCGDEWGNLVLGHFDAV